MLQNVLPQTERLRGRQHLQTVIVRKNLADVLAATGEWSEACGFYETSLSELTRSFSFHDERTLQAADGLARVYRELQHFDDLFILCATSLAAQRMTLGENDRQTLRARYNLDVAMVLQGKRQEGLEAWTKHFRSAIHHWE